MNTTLLVLYGIMLLKAVFIVVLFSMNVAVILTWADRRQGAMIQDRVGPNRAVIWLPGWLARAGVLIPAVAVVAGILFWALHSDPAGRDRSIAAILMSQLAILWLWVTALAIASRVRRRGRKNSFDDFILAIIRRLGSVRAIAIVGIATHFVTLLLAISLRGAGVVPLFDVKTALLRDIAYGSGTGLLCLAMVGGALYAFWTMRREKRVGVRLLGLLHPLADGVKTLWKEDFIPPNADRFLHGIAPLISFFPALVVLAVVPFGDTLCLTTGVSRNHTVITGVASHVPAVGVCTGDFAIPLQGISLNVGILYFFALAGTGVVGAALAGWASDNKFSLLGGLRAASQMVSYEVTMGLALIGAFMVYGSLRVEDMVRWQAQHAWGIFVQPVAFVLFFVAAVAESKRIPFDLPEGESEIVAGYYTEYSGMKFAMFFFAEYVAVVSSSALMAALFLGGWHLPFVFRSGIDVTIGDARVFAMSLPHIVVIVIGVIAFIAKTMALCFLQLTIRWTLPRFRYDQLMRLGWRMLLPASIANILATGLVMLALDSAGVVVVGALRWLGNASMAVLAAGGAALFAYTLYFLLRPVKKQRLLSSTAAQFAAAQGGTRTLKMGA